MSGEAGAVRRHTVCLREASGSFVPHADGLTLDSQGLRWTGEAGEQMAGYSDIVSIRLQSAFGRNAPDAAICVLNFRDGRELTITSQDPITARDTERALAYRQFIVDLHRRIRAGHFIGIAFVRGSLSRRRAIIRAGGALAAAICVVGPALAAPVTGQWQMLLIAVGGAALWWLILRRWRQDAPGHYQPDQIPRELMPS